MEDIVIVSESGGVPVKKGNRWLVTIAKPGQGSMGFYPEDVLKETGPVAFPPGTKAFFNHDPKRDVRDMVGTYEEGAFWNSDEGELQAYLTPFPRYADVLEEAGKNVEASIHAAVRKDPRTGKLKELVYSRANTVDLVSFAGLEGSGLKYQIESLFAEAAADGEAEKNKENNVEITKEMWDANASALSALSAKFDTFLSESKQTLQGVADEAAVEAAAKVLVEEALANYAEVEKSINDASIPATVKESLKEKARLGEDVTEGLAFAVSVAEESLKEAKPTPRTPSRGNVVVVSESLNEKPTAQSIIPGQWGKKKASN